MWSYGHLFGCCIFIPTLVSSWCVVWNLCSLVLRSILCFRMHIFSWPKIGVTLHIVQTFYVLITCTKYSRIYRKVFFKVIRWWNNGSLHKRSWRLRWVAPFNLLSINILFSKELLNMWFVAFLGGKEECIVGISWIKYIKDLVASCLLSLLRIHALLDYIL